MTGNAERNLFQPGDQNPNWKGGETIASNGYKLIRLPDHPLADKRGYVYEHRFIASIKLGRQLEPGEIVHHIDGNKLNNSPENLSVEKSVAAHRTKHCKKDASLRLPGEENPIVTCACGCGQEFRKYDAYLLVYDPDKKTLRINIVSSDQIVLD